MTTTKKTVKFPDEVNAAIVTYTMPIQWGTRGNANQESIRVMGMRQRLECSGTDVRFPAKGQITNLRAAFSRNCSNVLNLRPIGATGSQQTLTADERANRQWYTISTVITFPKGSAVTFTGFADAQRLGRSEIVVGAGDLKIQPYSLSDDELTNNFGTVNYGSNSSPEQGANEDEGTTYSYGDEDLADQISVFESYTSYEGEISWNAYVNYAQRIINALSARKAYPPTADELPPGVLPARQDEYDSWIHIIYNTIQGRLAQGIQDNDGMQDAMNYIVENVSDPKFGLVTPIPWESGSNYTTLMI